mmetsp:Transcript_15610/g.48825  ORF Transcript_15610/g.48825 Transcript_15610/m.48825 type:complete len:384 (-) Transcript_15610:129-1280(-)
MSSQGSATDTDIKEAGDRAEKTRKRVDSLLQFCSLLLDAGSLVPVIGTACEAAKKCLKNIQQANKDVGDLSMIAERINQVLCVLERIQATATSYLDTAAETKINPRIIELQGSLDSLATSIEKFGNSYFYQVIFSRDTPQKQAIEVQLHLANLKEIYEVEVNAKVFDDLQVLKDRFSVDDSVLASFMRACRDGKNDEVRKILKGHPFLDIHSRFRLDEVDRPLSAIHYAVLGGHATTVELLVGTYHANPRQADDHGTTPLLRAAAHGELEIVKSLVKRHQVSVEESDTTRRTALMAAADRGHIEVVKWLCEDGNADPTCKDSEGCKAVQFAQKRVETGPDKDKYRFTEVARYLKPKSLTLWERWFKTLGTPFTRPVTVYAEVE